jgi:hypothetical protein
MPRKQKQPLGVNEANLQRANVGLPTLSAEEVLVYNPTKVYHRIA